LKQAISERDNAQAECLILQQIHAQNKGQDQEQIAEMKDEIKELREKLDRTEFII